MKGKIRKKTRTRKRNNSQNRESYTIFDDVFRTMVQKMPELMIALINEMFGTDFPEDVEYDQLRNEHYEEDGKIITDSIFRI